MLEFNLGQVGLLGVLQSCCDPIVDLRENLKVLSALLGNQLLTERLGFLLKQSLALLPRILALILYLAFD